MVVITRQQCMKSGRGCCKPAVIKMEGNKQATSTSYNLRLRPKPRKSYYESRVTPWMKRRKNKAMQHERPSLGENPDKKLPMGEEPMEVDYPLFEFPANVSEDEPVVYYRIPVIRGGVVTPSWEEAKCFVKREVGCDGHPVIQVFPWEGRAHSSRDSFHEQKQDSQQSIEEENVSWAMSLEDHKQDLDVSSHDQNQSRTFINEHKHDSDMHLENQIPSKQMSQKEFMFTVKSEEPKPPQDMMWGDLCGLYENVNNMGDKSDTEERPEGLCCQYEDLMDNENKMGENNEPEEHPDDAGGDGSSDNLNSGMFFGPNTRNVWSFESFMAREKKL